MKITEIFCIANPMITGSNPTLTDTFLIYFFGFSLETMTQKLANIMPFMNGPLANLQKIIFS